MTGRGIGVIDAGIGIEKALVQRQHHARDAPHYLVRFLQDQLHLPRIFAVLGGHGERQRAGLDIMQKPQPFPPLWRRCSPRRPECRRPARPGPIRPWPSPETAARSSPGFMRSVFMPKTCNTLTCNALGFLSFSVASSILAARRESRKGWPLKFFTRPAI